MSVAFCYKPYFSIDFKSYSENEDFLVEGKWEPCSRSQTLVFRSGDLKWWIKVTFRGEEVSNLLNNSAVEKNSKRERRKEYQDSVRLIDYGSLPLLDHTVTEVILEESTKEGGFAIKIYDFGEPANNPFANLVRRLNYTIREDPSRVVYPSCLEFPSPRQVHATELSEHIEITDGVFQVFNVNDKTPYVLKVVDRPLYQPHDTEVIRNELKALEYFQGEPNIVQVAGVAVITNPYAKSDIPEQPLVISGILLVFYPGGSFNIY